MDARVDATTDPLHTLIAMLALQGCDAFGKNKFSSAVAGVSNIIGEKYAGKDDVDAAYHLKTALFKFFEAKRKAKTLKIRGVDSGHITSVLLRNLDAVALTIVMEYESYHKLGPVFERIAKTSRFDKQAAKEKMKKFYRECETLDILLKM